MKNVLYMKQKIVLFWARRDFRLFDNPALFHAIEYSKKEDAHFLPIFIVDNSIITTNIGYPRSFYLSKIMPIFFDHFDDFCVFSGETDGIFSELMETYDLEVFVNHDVEEFSRNRDTKIAHLVGAEHFHAFRDQISVNQNIVSGSGSLYSVFTPFRNAVLQEFLDNKPFGKADLQNLTYFQSEKITTPSVFATKQTANFSEKLFKFIDKPWTFSVGGFDVNLDEIHNRPNFEQWYISEKEVLETFELFVKNKITNYKLNRDSLDLDTQENGQTSKMSVALKWGLVSPRTLKEMIISVHNNTSQEGIFAYISELIWREFYKYILYHHPQVLDLEFQKKYQNSIEWRTDAKTKEHFIAWIKGETGFKIVDAAMHQIAQTGWMHNRSRMVVASFLTKHLGIDWRWGQEYFRSVLLDLDEASNNGGWQWAASVGADPKPMRIFNPYLQGERYDIENKYQKKWLPSDYNFAPIVDHATARNEALTRYKKAV